MKASADEIRALQEKLKGTQEVSNLLEVVESHDKTSIYPI